MGWRPFFVILTIITIFLSTLPSLTAIPTVLVSVAPHQFFVEKIANDTVHVQLMVPAGASAHTYEPSPKQMLGACQGKLWFRIGESFEQRAIQSLTSHNPNLKIVDLRQGLDLIHQDKQTQCHCCSGSEDLHFWLSARLAQIQAKTIADALIEAFPEYKKLYVRNLKIFQQELQELDQTILELFKTSSIHSVLVSHPAYGYFCRDYHLQQYSVELEGKDPTPQQMTKLLIWAKEHNIRTIFVQPQYNNKAAQLVAGEIGAKIRLLDPYSKLYFKSMLEIAHAFAGE
ncbi:metal ABC transporter solute-binding protein, Zn/Mn family [Candidatus Protochlamydia sp. W-9]|uniref:metal ABC transporter solute-binding protein, Zn/Mn family n=1 Tax=Candidatus Protochlamydia sp. W-9 TaxID=1785087 RepID=UPI00096A4480|nr:zinc ABC transporter substrate-binding protein [Candidatus Protochlamydia sp. W-9]